MVPEMIFVVILNFSKESSSSIPSEGNIGSLIFM
tara:strand:+ start:331 stop:432 length:102 start_codon:yes stop_codon:yes gene_type:complete